MASIPVERIELGALGDAVVADMLGEATAESPLPAQRLAELAQRAGGNPLFVRELVTQLQHGADPDALPRSVEAAITMRIDRLSSADRHTLRSAAVLGMEVEVALLREVLAADAETASRNDDPLARLSDVLDPLARLSEFLEPIGPDRYSFTHQLVRAVTYEGLPYRRRAELHSRTAAAIERAAGEQANQHAELLAMHCFHGGRFAAAYAYARLAAQHARARYANAEAAESYRRALASAARLEHADAPVLAEVEEALAEIYVERGEMTAADLTLGRAVRRVRDTPLALARLQLKLAGLRETEARFRAAVGWADRAERTLTGLDGPEVRVIRGQLATRRARLNYRRARYDEAMSFANVAIALSAADDRPTLAEALEYADLYVELGLPAGRRAEEALAIHEELGDLAAQAPPPEHAWDARLPPRRMAQGARALCGLRAGRHPLREALERGDARGQPGGDPLRPGPAGGGTAGFREGDAHLARRQRTVDDRVWRVPARPDRGAPGPRRRGDALLRRLPAALRRAGRAHRGHGGRRAQGRGPVAGRRSRGGLALADATLARAQWLGGVSAMTPLLHRVRGIALRELGQTEEAELAMRDALDAARSRIARHEIAFTLAALLDGQMGDGEAENEEWGTELARLTEELGIDPRPRWSRQTARA